MFSIFLENILFSYFPHTMYINNRKKNNYKHTWGGG